MSRTAETLHVGDKIGRAVITAREPVMAVCSPRPGAQPVPAYRFTFEGGTSVTLAADVRVAA